MPPRNIDTRADEIPSQDVPNYDNLSEMYSEAVETFDTLFKDSSLEEDSTENSLENDLSEYEKSEISLTQKMDEAKELFHSLYPEKSIDDKQTDSINEAFDKIEKNEELTSAEKGNLGEILMDQYYTEQGYTPIHQPRVSDLSHKSGKGIDGVYEKVNPDGTKCYVIGEAKVNSSQLNKGLADGTNQLDDKWVNDRLDDAVGKEKADEIRDAFEDDPDSVRKEVFHFSYGEMPQISAQADIYSVDETGNKNDDKRIVCLYDQSGKPIPIEGGTKIDEGY